MNTESAGPAACVVVDPGTNVERTVAIRDRLYVGRECAGVSVDQRLLIDDELVSRNHLEIWLEPEQDRAFVMDLSTNGTRLNGTRIERAKPVSIQPGDRLRLGSREFEFRSDHYRDETTEQRESRRTFQQITVCRLAMVVGDIVSYSTISEYTDEGVLLKSVDALYGELRALLEASGGQLNNYVGDAFFAIWEVGHGNDGADASRRALGFALQATARVKRVAPDLPLRDAFGSPIRMGWGVTVGQAAVSSMTGMMVTVLGDATNVAFRISGLAGRDGRSDVMATKSIYDLTADQFQFGPPEDVQVKGRTITETLYPLVLPAAG